MNPKRKWKKNKKKKKKTEQNFFIEHMNFEVIQGKSANFIRLIKCMDSKF
jgi:predicted ribosome quality control (RQC) complex YloA/Tae2 family protein